jgi:hypothetical protein
MPWRPRAIGGQIEGDDGRGEPSQAGHLVEGGIRGPNRVNPADKGGCGVYGVASADA